MKTDMEDIKSSWKNFHLEVSNERTYTLTNAVKYAKCSARLATAYRKLGWVVVHHRENVGAYTYTGPEAMTARHWQMLKKACADKPKQSKPTTPELSIPAESKPITMFEYLRETSEAILCAELARRGWFGVIQKEETLQGINYRQSMAIGGKKD